MRSAHTPVLQWTWGIAIILFPIWLAELQYGVGIPEGPQNLPLQRASYLNSPFLLAVGAQLSLTAQFLAATQKNPHFSVSSEKLQVSSKGQDQNVLRTDPCQKTSQLVASTLWRISFTHKQRLGHRFTAPMIFMGFLLRQGWLEPSTKLCFPDL